MPELTEDIDVQLLSRASEAIGGPAISIISFGKSFDELKLSNKDFFIFLDKLAEILKDGTDILTIASPLSTDTIAHAIYRLRSASRQIYGPTRKYG